MIYTFFLLLWCVFLFPNCTIAASPTNAEPLLRSVPRSPSVQLFKHAPPAIDNLKKISGIGPAFERTLNKLGLYTFEQIAELSDGDIEWVAQELRSFPDRILNGHWVEQAKNLLADRD